MSAERTPLPGRDESIDYITEPDKALRSLLIGFDEAEMPMTSLREIAMLNFMDEITEKPEWNIHINDPEVVAQWRQEALSSGDDFTQKMLDWCIGELRYNASLIPAEGSAGDRPPLFVHHGDVYKSDTALPVEFKEALQDAIIKFEDTIPANLKDYRPGSDGKIWDLVDPSLFPLVYGQTRVLKMEDPITTLSDCLERSGEGNIISFPGKGRVKRRDYTEELPFSKKFQWLPCEVDLSGDEPIITSYVNNLHPSEKPLYGLLGKIIKASISLWDLTLAPAFRKPCDFVFRVSYNIQDDENILDVGDDGSDGDEDGDGDGGSHSSLPDIRPEPKMPFSPLPAPNKLSLTDKYGHLQVIVKLTNVELTPAKPICEDNRWHIETPLNEHIVATSLYFYSCSNIKTSTVSFRHIFPKSDTELDRSQRPKHPHWLTSIFGVEQETNAVQDLGAIGAPEGRLLTYPNTLQYSMDTVELEDLSKPGHLKLVVLYLVDPNIKIISTAQIPCQRQDWVEEVGHPSQAPSHFPISYQDAKGQRRELLNEREEFEGEFESMIELISDNYY